jgi:hypothetical protein
MRKVTMNGQEKKRARVEQQEREREGEKKICSTLRKRESENEEIAERVCLP